VHDPFQHFIIPLLQVICVGQSEIDSDKIPLLHKYFFDMLSFFSIFDLFKQLYAAFLQVPSGQSEGNLSGQEI
jgi:hypothetical protein